MARQIQLYALACCMAAFPLIPRAAAQAKQQCSVSMPSDSRAYWSWRLIDGRQCWYEGKPMLSKSMLHWLPARTAQADPARELNVLPANSYNLLDAQAPIQGDSDAFEARWRARFLEAIEK